MYQFSKINIDDESNARNAALLAETFQKPHLFTPEYIAWQYRDNPAGEIVGFNAVSGEEIAAHYVAQPVIAHVMGSRQKGLLSLNTATHFRHRGKGLFTKLAEATYQEAANLGYGFVVGVANQNSIHGFVKYLGFQLLGQLDSKIGWGAIEEMPLESSCAFDRIWDEKGLAWRLANPNAQYYGRKHQGKVSFFTKTHIPFIKGLLYSGVLHQQAFGLKKPNLAQQLTLYIGKDPMVRYAKQRFVDIPQRFKPAPLYLIFKSLTHQNLHLKIEDIRFRLIDFDAY